MAQNKLQGFWNNALWTDKTKGKRFGHKTQTQDIITKTSFQLSSMVVEV